MPWETCSLFLFAWLGAQVENEIQALIQTNATFPTLKRIFSHNGVLSPLSAGISHFTCYKSSDTCILTSTKSNITLSWNTVYSREDTDMLSINASGKEEGSIFMPIKLNKI